ncbi:L-lactate permease, partial [bacterium]|nr:L-lactate permease [bacterium]
RLSLNEFKNIVLISFNKSKLVLLTLIFTLAFVQLIIYSNLNTSNLNGIPQIIALQFSNLGFFYLFVSPFIGAFGSYIAGSATVSNLIFSSLQESVAINNSLSSSLVLALQLAGASAGNMIAIHNIIAVLALVSLNGMESKIMKINLLIVFIYCFVLGLLAYLMYLFF